MTKTKVRQRIAAAFPFREVSQPKAVGLAFPDTYAQVDVAGTQNATNTGISSSVAQVLQTTLRDASNAVTQNNKQLSDVQAAQQQLLASTNQNTQAVNSNTAVKGGTGSSTLAMVGTAAGSILGQGSLLSPIVSGLMSLFNSGATPQPNWTPYVAPSPVQLETVLTGAASAPVQASSSGQSGGLQNSGRASSQVQIQVNAIDAKSFLDHSDEIAEAVRQALLNSHSLSDVIAGI